jgi:hypothetical protein
MAQAPNRFSLAILMGFIGVLAVGLGLMRNGSWLASRITLAVLPVVLLVGLLGALVRRGEGSWVGFALFGWSYALLAFTFPPEAEYGRRINPISDLVNQLIYVYGLHPGPGPRPAAPTFNPQFDAMLGDPQNLAFLRQGRGNSGLLNRLTDAEKTTLKAYQDQFDSYNRGVVLLAERQANAKGIGHALFAMIFALIGSVLGRVLQQPGPHVDTSTGIPTPNSHG